MGQLIIYGAGRMGKSIFPFLSYHNKAHEIYGFCDKNYLEIQQVGGKKVYSYEMVKELGLLFLLAIDGEAGEEVRRQLEADGQTVYDMNYVRELLGMDRVSFNRQFCAWYHVNSMDDYFMNAEDEFSMNIFWGPEFPFFRMFQRLDLTNVIELACGRGRHVQKYMGQAKEITLVDILEKNIDFCKKRFQGCENVHYYCNNGYNLEELAGGVYSSLFSYDAVVHFEMMDIFEYLKDIHRVLKPGAYALIHHSNNDRNYRASFAAGNAPHRRNFMSQTIFAYLAYRAGFEIIEQETVDFLQAGWPIDCVSLIRKTL